MISDHRNQKELHKGQMSPMGHKSAMVIIEGWNSPVWAEAVCTLPSGTFRLHNTSRIHPIGTAFRPKRQNFRDVWQPVFTKPRNTIFQWLGQILRAKTRRFLPSGRYRLIQDSALEVSEFHPSSYKQVGTLETFYSSRTPIKVIQDWTYNDVWPQEPTRAP